MDFSKMGYCFHDTQASKIEYKNGKLYLEFPQGVYILKNNKELRCTPQCILNIEMIDNILAHHIDIKKMHKRKIDEIKLEAMQKLLKKNCFDIEMEYYSYFEQAIMFIGFIGKYKIQITVSEVQKVEFYFGS